VEAQPGGACGGGAVLTDFGHKLARDYRAIESEAASATRKLLKETTASLRSERSHRRDKVNRLPIARGRR